jgi:hypothetical protein
MVPVNSFTKVMAFILALRRRVSHNQWIELTALEHRGSARKGKEEFALSGLGKRLLAAAHLGRYNSGSALRIAGNLGSE